MQFKATFLLLAVALAVATASPVRLINLYADQFNLGASIPGRSEHGVVTSVKNKGQCGSCWTFATVGSIESSYLMNRRATDININFSEQQIVDCAKDNGCQGGNSMTDFGMSIDSFLIILELTSLLFPVIFYFFLSFYNGWQNSFEIYLLLLTIPFKLICLVALHTVYGCIFFLVIWAMQNVLQDATATPCYGQDNKSSEQRGEHM